LIWTGLHDHHSTLEEGPDEDVELTLRLLLRLLKKLPRNTEVVLGIADMARTGASAEALQRYFQQSGLTDEQLLLPTELPKRWLPILKFAKASKLEVAPMGLPEAVVRAVSGKAVVRVAYPHHRLIHIMAPLLDRQNRDCRD